MKTSKLKPKRDGRVRSSELVMPRTEAEWCAYRCQLSCKIGRDVLEGKTKTPAGVSPLEYAIFNLLHAVEELSRHNDPSSATARTWTNREYEKDTQTKEGPPFAAAHG